MCDEEFPAKQPESGEGGVSLRFSLGENIRRYAPGSVLFDRRMKRHGPFII